MTYLDIMRINKIIVHYLSIVVISVCIASCDSNPEPDSESRFDQELVGIWKKNKYNYNDGTIIWVDSYKFDIYGKMVYIRQYSNGIFYQWEAITETNNGILYYTIITENNTNYGKSYGHIYTIEKTPTGSKVLKIEKRPNESSEEYEYEDL